MLVHDPLRWFMAQPRLRETIVRAVWEAQGQARRETSDQPLSYEMGIRAHLKRHELFSRLLAPFGFSLESRQASVFVRKDPDGGDALAVAHLSGRHEECGFRVNQVGAGLSSKAALNDEHWPAQLLLPGIVTAERRPQACAEIEPTILILVEATTEHEAVYALFPRDAPKNGSVIQARYEKLDERAVVDVDVEPYMAPVAIDFDISEI